MKTKQVKTIGRLVEMKRRSAEAAEAAFATAHSVAESAARSKVDAEQRWLAALDANDHIGSAADLERRDLHLRARRRALDDASARLARASAEEDERRAAMTGARIELRRFEKWLERRVEVARTEHRRAERVAEDETAARAKRAG